MSIRALGYLLGRRFSPRGFSQRGIPRARVQAQEETLGSALHRPLRHLNTSRDLGIRDGAIGALAAAGGIAALFGILYSNGAMTGKKTTNFVTDMKRHPVDDPAIRAKFMDEAGKVAWLEYLEYINFLMLHPEVTDKKVHDEMIQRRYVKKTEELEDMKVDEPAMKARFEEWMKQFGRTYKNEEEKAMRYELFKASAIMCDKTNASNPDARYAPNDLADYTDEEKYGPCYQKDDSYWEEYFNEISRVYAEGRVDGYPRTVGTDQRVGWTDTAKQWYRILKARKAGLDAARKAEQAAEGRTSRSHKED